MDFQGREEKRATRGVASVIAGKVKDEGKVDSVTKGRPKAERETKKRVSLVILPSLYKKIQQIAYVERSSVSEIISQCLEQYVNKNAVKLKEYEQLTKK